MASEVEKLWEYSRSEWVSLFGRWSGIATVGIWIWAVIVISMVATDVEDPFAWTTFIAGVPFIINFFKGYPRFRADHKASGQ